MRRWYLGFVLMTLAVSACDRGASTAATVEPPKSFPIVQGGRVGFIDARGEITITPTLEPWFIPPQWLSLYSPPPPQGQQLAGAVMANIDAEGRLQAGQQQIWLIYPQPGTPFTLDLTSTDFDTYLELLQVRNNQWVRASSNDDGGYGYNSRLWWPAREGIYAARVGSYRRSGGGRFVLRLGQGNRATSAGGAAAEPTSAALFAVAGLLFRDGMLPYRVGDRWGFLAEDGTVVISPQFDAALPFTEGLAGVKQGDRWGFVDRSGTMTIQPQYDMVASFAGGRAVVRVGAKCGYISSAGEFVIAPQYDTCRDFEGGRAVVQRDRRFGVIDTDGEAIIAPQFEALTAFAGDLAAAKIGERFGLVDETGKIVLSPQYDDMQPPIEGDLWLVRSGDRYGFVDQAGKFAIGPTLDAAYPFRDGVARVRMGERWGFMAPDGKFVGNTGALYDEAQDMVNGLAAVRLDKDWGFVDKAGKLVIAPQYDFVGPFLGSIAMVIDDGMLGYISQRGAAVFALSR